MHIPIPGRALASLALLGTLLLGTASTGSADSLPPMPPGVPAHFSFGLFNANKGTLPPGVSLDFRYQYLSGGANNGGWATWNSNGGYVTTYINDARAAGMTPAFIYYQILQSKPGPDEFTNLQNSSTMRAYYDDFKLLMQRAGQAGGDLLVDIEPDLTGMMQKHSSNRADDASSQPTSVASSGHPDVQGYPNNFRGFYQALAHLRDLYAPNVKLGLDISAWGAGADITIVRDPAYDWRNHATRVARYVNSLGPGYQMLFFNPSDRDAAYYQTVKNSNRWWDPNNATLPHFDRMADWLGTIVTQTNKRVLIWQMPNGNRVYRSMNNTDGHWQDNRAEYFLNPSNGRAHLQQWADRGVLGIMFGAGVGSQAHYFDYKNDGVTNPAPVNGNNAVAEYPDDDGGYLRLQLAAYRRGGTLPLPGGGGQPQYTATSAFSFKLGFAALAGQIPSIVGGPLENEHHGANGDSLQITANGLMVWRKADNWTAFTNGYMTWVNGPFGIQQRLNTQRFPWEG